MFMKGGYRIARGGQIPWEDRVNVDGWPSRAGMYYDDRSNDLCMRLIDYPVGSTEPRHVHAGMHATTVLKGSAIVDGLTLGPLDVILGPSNEPHGPLHYPQGCKLFSAFQGSYYHSEVEQLSGEKQYRLIQADAMPWTRADEGVEVKTLVDHGLGRLLLEARRYAPETRMAKPPMLAVLMVEGEAVVEGERLGPWDFLYADADAIHAEVTFPRGATLLAITMR
jgi:hypothetical protein